MSLDFHLQQKLTTELRMAPHIIQSIEILTLPALELHNFIQEQLETNPLLETQDSGSDDQNSESDENSANEDREDSNESDDKEDLGELESDDENNTNEDREDFMEANDREDSISSQEHEDLGKLESDDKNSGAEEYEVSDNLEKESGQALEEAQESSDKEAMDFSKLDSEEWQENFGSGNVAKKDSEESDKKQEAMQNTASRPVSLQDYLCEQFKLVELPENIKILGEEIIYNINEKGYLRYPLEEIIKPLGNQFSLSDAEIALANIQKLDPPGVGARNTQECLLLQLNKEHPDYEFHKIIIEKYLLDINNNKFPKITKETGKSLEEIKKALAFLQKLNPLPGANYSSENSQIVAPDVIVENVEGEYIIRLEDRYIPQLRINSYYQTHFQNDRSAKDFVKKKMESANWLIEAIRQRQRTLYRVAKQIVLYQKDFLDHGISQLKPLRMQEVADTLGISVSTVSRAASDKYMQTPRGIFPMKFFFTGSIDKGDGENESRVSVKDRIAEIIEKEDKAHPLSDEEIVEKLQEAGLNIARRTITKYREALGIRSSRRRKTY